MRWLARRGLPVSLDRLEAFVDGHGTLPDEAVVVTVDDGFRSVLSALPVVREHAIPMVAFVCPGLIERPAASDPEPRLRWDDVEALAAGGVTIGSHSWSHRSMARLERAEAVEEAARSREALERRLGRRTRAFAYPFGTLADFDGTTAGILRQCGYTTAFTSQHGSVRAGADPLALPRVKVEGGEGMWLFQLLALGALDPWAVVDRTLWRLQASER
jgi:peptidoglycan/xylan/chitin deacetylase (PgdA/CDA1 family)